MVSNGTKGIYTYKKVIYISNKNKIKNYEVYKKDLMRILIK
jgi:hypothetical protein